MTNGDAINKASTDIAAALQAGSALAGLAGVEVRTTPDGRHFMVVPKDLELKDLSLWQPTPRRLEQTVNVLTPDALIDYIKLFGEKDRSIVFADKPNSTFTAILDYHTAPNAPSWNKHRAVCTLVHTPAWNEWNEKDGVAMNQTAFSEFLEEHIPDIVNPDGATLVELARTFEAKKIVQFKSHQRAQDGSVAFMFDEDVQGSHKAGTVKVPATFDLNIAPYEGAAQVRMSARLKYRLNGANLSLSFDLVRPQDVIDVAFAQFYAHIGGHTAESCRKVIYGTAL